MSAYQEITEKMNQIQKKRMADLYELDSKATNFRKDEVAAQEQATQAREALDMKAYHKAMDTKRDAADCREMLATKAQALRKTKLVTDKEGYQLESQIRGVFKDYTDHLMKEFKEVAARALEVEQECEQLTEEGNKLLYKLQHEFLLDDACRTNANGEKYHSPLLEKHLDPFDTLNTLTQLLNDTVGRYRTEKTYRNWGPK